MGQRIEPAHRSTDGQLAGRDARGSRRPARDATICPQTDERGIRRVRQQDARAAFQTHDRSVSPE